jgi:CHAT domain-containing protein
MEDGAWSSCALRKCTPFAESVREAQLAILRDGVEQARTDASRGLLRTAPTPSTGKPSQWNHPYFWAPFVLHGANGAFR